MDFESDRVLVARVRAGDERAFRALFDVAFRLAWAFAVRGRGDLPEARLQTTRILLTGFQRLSAFEGRASFGTWLLGGAQDGPPAVAVAAEGLR